MRRMTTLVGAAFLGAMLAVPVTVYASHRFKDVPESHTFHDDIDWIADNGITFGCNPPNNDEYCPDDLVTRGQMAAFMKRLATGMGPRAASATEPNPPDGADYRLSVELAAPAPGVLVISGGVGVENETSADIYACGIEVNNDVVPGTFSEHDLAPAIGIPDEDCKVSGGLVVSEGKITIDLEVINVASSTRLGGASLWALWVPFDGNGAVPAS